MAGLPSSTYSSGRIVRAASRSRGLAPKTVQRCTRRVLSTRPSWARRYFSMPTASSTLLIRESFATLIPVLTLNTTRRVKTRIQADSSNGCSVRALLKRILEEEGIAGFYRGFGATMLNTFSMRPSFSSSLPPFPPPHLPTRNARPRCRRILPAVSSERP